jgi:MFS family permease
MAELKDPETIGSVLLRIAPSSLLPAFVYEIGNGAIAPITALVALSEGASPSLAAIVLSLIGIGRILGDVPAAWMADRLGDRRAMMVAASITTGALLLNWWVPNLWALSAGQIVIGMCNATFYLARQTYVSEVVPLHLRARALSTLAGAHRVGLFVGPLLGAAAISLWGTRAAFGVAVVTTVATGILLYFVPDEGKATDRPPGHRGGSNVRTMFNAHRRLFLTLGIAVFAVGAVRAARQTVLPLWANHIGLSATETSLIFAVANAVDMSLFYPSGQIMDRFGRRSIVIPAMVLLGLGMIALPFAHSVAMLGVFAVIMSTGNGIGSGIMMTIGGDVAPADNRTTFLSIWRLIADTGNAAGPLIPAAIAAIATLGIGISITGVVGLVAAGGMGRWLPRYSPYATHAMAREHRAALAGQATDRAHAQGG